MNSQNLRGGFKRGKTSQTLDPSLSRKYSHTIYQMKKLRRSPPCLIAHPGRIAG